MPRRDGDEEVQTSAQAPGEKAVTTTHSDEHLI